MGHFIRAIRYGLQKYFLVNKADIINDPRFLSSRNMFFAVCVNFKRKRKGTVQHKVPSTTKDFKKLYSSHLLHTSSPYGLQNKVFVEIIVHLCNRGRENLRNNTRGNYHILTDS